MTETNITRTILLEITKRLKNVRLFRNNTGVGWQGNSVHRTSCEILIKNPRPLNAGLCPGSADLIGWTTVEITPDMIGHKIAIFTALEVKTPSGRTSDEQAKFLSIVHAAGGIAEIVTNENAAFDVLASQ